MRPRSPSIGIAFRCAPFARSACALRARALLMSFFARSALTLPVLGLACRGADSTQGAAASSRPVASTAPSAPSPAAAGTCAAPDIVAPFQKYSDDMIRGVTADASSVYFRTLRDTFRVPLAGGTPEVIAKSPPGMDGPMWLLGDKLIDQPTGQPTFVVLPKGGGTWTNFLDATSDKSGGSEAVPTILHNVARGRIEAAEQALFDGKDLYWIEKDDVVTGHGGGGQSTWSIRRMPASAPKAEILYTSTRDLEHLVKADDLLGFQENDTPEKPPLPPGAKKPLFEAEVWSLYAIPAAGGKPTLRAASVSTLNGTRAASDGSDVYYSAQGDTPGAVALYRVPLSGSGGPERVADGVADVQFAAPYGADRSVLFVRAFEAKDRGLKPFVYSVSRATGQLGARQCLNASNPHGYAVAGNALLFASQLQDGSGAQGIVRWTLP
jgi:hypothetical protein